MITILISIVAGLLTYSATGWAVFWSLVIFQILIGGEWE